VVLSVQIAPATAANSYSFLASGTRVTPATSNPVPVTIAIGDDMGTASVSAKFQ